MLDERLLVVSVAGIAEPPLPGHFSTGMGPLSLTFSNSSLYGFLLAVIGGCIVYRYYL